MTTWAELVTEVMTLTNRTQLIVETDIAIRNAIRTAHKSGKYWRDLKTAQITPTQGLVQSFDLTSLPRMRQVAYLKSAEVDRYFTSATIDGLLDADGCALADIYWGLGNSLNIRARVPELTYELAYYAYPVVFPKEQLSSWIVDTHTDLIVLWAASSVLTAAGEQEIKKGIDQLAAISFVDLIQDNLEIQGR
jgi:hypothetical protein